MEDSQKTLTPCRLYGQLIACSESNMNPASGSVGTLAHPSPTLMYSWLFNSPNSSFFT